MSKLNYKTKSDGQLIQKSKYYNVKSFYKDSELMDMFLRLKANVCGFKSCFSYEMYYRN